MTLTVERHPPSVLPAVASAWDRLAEQTTSPFLSTAWLTSWAQVHPGRVSVLLAREADGTLRAGACLRPGRVGTASATDVHSGSWTVLAGDDAARAALWREVARTGGPRIALDRLPTGGPSLAAAQAALQDAGYLVTVRTVATGPRLALPPTADALLASLSRGLRSQYRRRTRALERLGPVELRTATEQTVERDLEVFLDLEASGWKRQQGTAIRMSPSTLRLYRGFALDAARSGMLRLQLLEVAGRAVAGDLSFAFGGGMHMVKTAYDEQLSDASPGLVLRGLALEAAIAEGCAFYDFLGGAELYKLRWGGAPQHVAALRAYRGPARRLCHEYEQRTRPMLRRTVERVLAEVRPAARS